MNGRVAVIGSGISGLSAAWLLSRTQSVVLFEKQDRLGGHTNTLTVPTSEGDVPVDTGFIVYNEANYPNLTALFAYLGVSTSASNMSFAVSVDHGRMEYSGASINTLFGQRRNIWRAGHWQLVADIVRFFRLGEIQAQEIDDNVTLGQFLKHFGYSESFVEDHILPMSAAIWSTPARGMLDFPAKSFIEFFANHGLLQFGGRPKWRTVSGGSHNYIAPLLADGDFETRLNAHIVGVRRSASGAAIRFADGSLQEFDDVVFACHADQALGLLEDADQAERKVLSAFKFTNNRAVLHTDINLMPRRRQLWSSWNYLRTPAEEGADLSVTYWMNLLQPLPTTKDIFVTLNPAHEFAEGTVVADMVYEHPLFDTAALRAQKHIWDLQGRRNVWFAGAWLGYGFHEDGLQSGLEVAERIGGVSAPWQVAGGRARIARHFQADTELLQAAE